MRTSHRADAVFPLSNAVSPVSSHFVYLVVLFRQQWNPSNTDTLGPVKYVLIREVSSFQGLNSGVSFRRDSIVIPIRLTECA